MPRIISIGGHYHSVIKGLCALALGAILVSGATPARPLAHKGAAGNFTPRDDARIEQAIRAKLAKSKIGADGFQVHVQGGVATWEGRTAVIQHKGAATRMAKTAGAAAVVNRIEVSDEARRKAREKLQSGVRRAQLKRSDPRSEKR